MQFCNLGICRARRIAKPLARTFFALALAVPSLAQSPADTEFEATLPPLDVPPLDIEAVESTTPLSGAQIDADPALTTPLEPLGSVDLSPATVPDAQQSADTESTPEIAYSLVIRGLEDVGLEGRFRDLSALLDQGRSAENAAQISARADEDQMLAERLLKEQGYYDGAASIAISPSSKDKSDLVVTLTAVPGSRYAFGSIAITEAPPEPTELAREALALQTGDPIVAPDVQAAEATVAVRLPEQGYPFVEVGQRDILLDGETHEGDYSLPLDPGPKSTMGGIVMKGDPVFTSDHVRKLARFERGELYDSRMIDDLRKALIATGLYSSVGVEPQRTDNSSPEGTEPVDLLVTQNKGEWRTLAATAGYGTGEGIKVTGSWTHRNLFPPEGALILSAVAGTQEQSVNALFRRSNAGKRDRTAQAGISIARQDFEAYSARTVSLNGSIARASTPIWQKRWAWSIGSELTATRESRLIPGTMDRTNTTFFIAALPLQLTYDRSDSLLDPTKGFRITARLSPEAQKRSSGGFDGYIRALIEGTVYQRVSDGLVLAGRSRVGSIFGVSRDGLAPSRRYYSGGGGSVRGFGYQELGPRDANNDPLGGRSVTEFALEARYRFGDYGIVPFIDAGRVGAGSTPSLSGMRYGAGIGGR
ncbi:MAG: autotransporter assembly complex family protein, partial [Sphingomonadaceae bacterium]